MTPATLVSAAGASPWEAALVGALLARHSGVQVLARCFDVAQVLATASRVRPDVVLVGHDLEGLDREVIAQLGSFCAVVVGAYPPGDPIAVRRLIDLGCERAVPHDLDPLDLAGLVLELAGRPSSLEEHVARPSGCLLAVWGPTGAPGRTTLAVAIASAVSRGGDVLLIDADTYGAAVAQSLGLTEQPSLVSAAQRAATGAFSGDDLRELSQSAGGFSVLAGVPRPDCWPQVREASLLTVLQAARAAHGLTVVDVGFCLEEDEELSYSGTPLRRNLVARAVLQEADSVLAVCRGDPVGLCRFAQARPALEELVRGEVMVVVNRSLPSIAGRRKMEISMALERLGGMPPLAFIPEDPAAVECLWEGSLVMRARPRSPVARALSTLAREVSASLVARNSEVPALR
jgi:MinD-like ATPase involved in chromosome partitioning or flagellar assembly